MRYYTVEAYQYNNKKEKFLIVAPRNYFSLDEAKKLYLQIISCHMGEDISETEKRKIDSLYDWNFESQTYENIHKRFYITLTRKYIHIEDEEM